MPKIGAHISTAISLELAFDRAIKINAACMQLFISPPQQWKEISHPRVEIEAFVKKYHQTNIGPNFIHGIYLINLATDNLENLKKGIDWLVYSLKSASELKIAGTIFHLGSHKGLGFEKVKAQIVDSLNTVLSQTPKDTYLIMENSAGAGGAVGAKLEELGELINSVSSKRLKVCLDTQHAFASGYDLTTTVGVNSFVLGVKEKIGLENIVAIHANDSKTKLYSGKDRHANIGEGFIGEAGFKFLLQHIDLANIPFILEVPGLAGNGPDLENIQKMIELEK